MENWNNSRTTRAVTGKIKTGHCHKTHVILSPASVTINHHPLRAAHSESDPFLQCNFCSYYLRTPLEKVWINNSAGNTCQAAGCFMLLYLQQPHPTNYTSHYLSTGLTPHYNLILPRERASHRQHRYTAWDNTCLSQSPCTRELQCRNAWQDGAVGHVLRCRPHSVTRRVSLTAPHPNRGRHIAGGGSEPNTSHGGQWARGPLKPCRGGDGSLRPPLTVPRRGGIAAKPLP